MARTPGQPGAECGHVGAFGELGVDSERGVELIPGRREVTGRLEGRGEVKPHLCIVGHARGGLFQECRGRAMAA